MALGGGSLGNPLRDRQTDAIKFYGLHTVVGRIKQMGCVLLIGGPH